MYKQIYKDMARQTFHILIFLPLEEKESQQGFRNQEDHFVLSASKIYYFLYFK